MKDFTRHLLNELQLNEHVASTQEEQASIRLRKRMALARSITLVESTNSAHRGEADLLLTQLLSSKQENLANDSNNTYLRVGIAGPPGAGKSSFIETFGSFLLNGENDKNSRKDTSFHPDKLAVVCIDPSSTVTGGSILGDKTRMMNLSRHERAYVRPSSNGGTFGGLSGDTHDVVSLCQAASYSLVLVETVGLGQSEVEIAESVDMLILIVPPGGGDELQGVKKGIMEVADMLIVNKADGNLLPAARSTAADYRGAMQFIRPRVEGWKTPVLLTSAHTGEGVDKVWSKILEFQSLLINSGGLEKKRKSQSRYWMWKHLKNLIIQQTNEDPQLREFANEMENALDHGRITPRVAAAQLLDSLIHKDDDRD
jgi:LAO/AO transport system kinase